MKKDLAKIAYEGYCKSLEGKSLVSGQQLPEFEAMPESIKVAWNEAAHATVDAVMPFRFELDAEVSLKHSTEVGVVIGRAHYSSMEASYLIRYRAADGRQTEARWNDSAIK